IGDLPAQYSELMLHVAQPFPGDNDESQVARRFTVYRTSDEHYVVLDSESSTMEDVLLPVSYLENPKFELGLWYARHR
ncbi:hypothetical protein C8R45DRAFT_751360, partial [Mycena sanguinolenta]